MSTDQKYPLWTLGDFNAFFALFLDNIVNLVILAGILIGVFAFPTDIVYDKMIPGTALGVLVGDLIYSWMAIKLAKRTGRKDVTAMPLGLDTPSTIGVAFAVLGPAFLAFKSGGASPNDAAMMAWYVGMATLLWMSVVKFITAFFGAAIQRIVPEAGLLGSLAGIGVVWLAAQQFIETMQEPLVGLMSLGLVLFTLIARYRLPWHIPGAAAAVILGVVIFYLSSALGIFDTHADVPSLSKELRVAIPFIEPQGFVAFTSTALNYLPIAIPFGFLTIIGGINVTESARLAGDDYNTRDILLTEAFATLVAGLFGGVSQTTPYIGHSAYKKMGAHVGYTIATALLVGLGGMFGLVGFIVKLIPKAAVSPILIFVGFEITALAYQMSPRRHNMAVTFAIIPSILNFGYIKLKGIYESVKFGSVGILKAFPEQAEQLKPMLQGLVPFVVSHEYPYLEALAQGFILTAMVWGAAVAFLIDREPIKAMYALLAGAVMSLFGVIHSATSTGELYLPWEAGSAIPYKFAIAYALTGGMLYVLSLVSEKPKDDAEHLPPPVP